MESTTHRGEMVRGWSGAGDVFGSVLAGLLIGLALDAWLNTAPIFVMTFVVAASVGAFFKIKGETDAFDRHAEAAIRGRDGR